MGSCLSRSSSRGDEDDTAARESLPTSSGTGAAPPPNAAPQVSEAPCLTLIQAESDETRSEVSSEREFDEGPVDWFTENELYRAICDDGDLQKVKTLIKQHPSLLR